MSDKATYNDLMNTSNGDLEVLADDLGLSVTKDKDGNITNRTNIVKKIMGECEGCKQSKIGSDGRMKINPSLGTNISTNKSNYTVTVIPPVNMASSATKVMKNKGTDVPCSNCPQ